MSNNYNVGSNEYVYTYYYSRFFDKFQQKVDKSLISQGKILAVLPNQYKKSFIYKSKGIQKHHYLKTC